MATRFTLLDFETTGLDPERCEIIEIAAIRVEVVDTEFRELERYSTLVRPLGVVPKMISDLTGITNAMVETAPFIEDVVDAFAEFLGDLPIVAHNSAMEQGFLDSRVSPLIGGDVFTVFNSIDPLALLLPDHSSHSMESMRRFAGVNNENAHRAEKDCVDLLKVLEFAQAWMIRERPWLASLTEDLLPAWWWNWFFQPAHARLEFPVKAVELLVRENQGDLRDLRVRDGERIVEDQIEIPAEELQSGLEPGDRAPGFQSRESQRKMAETIRRTLEKGERIAIEAPTGTGKSVAYLLPGVLAARVTESPLVVSTHSKTLQDQLLEKDIPLVGRLLGGETGIRATTVKGQDNYLCLRKLHGEIALLPESGSEAAMGERYAAAFIVALAKVSRNAELDRISQYMRSQIPGMGPMIDRVRAHHTTTTGPICPFYKSCHFFGSARLAHQSEVIIANHSLVFHWPDHLPKLRNLVFDEAHHLEDQLTDSEALALREIDLAESIDRIDRRSTRSKRGSDGAKIERLMQGLKLKPGRHGETTLEEFCDGMRAKVRELSQAIPITLNRGVRDTGGFEDHLDLALLVGSPLFMALLGLQERVQGLSDHFTEALESISEGPFKSDPANDLLKLHASRFAEYAEALTAAVAVTDGPNNWLRLLFWNPREALWRLSISPIEVKTHGREFFQELRSAVLTSATLSSGSLPTFVTDRVGLELSQPFLSLPSPYPLSEQALVFLPSDVAQPGTPAHSDALIGFTEQVARSLGGRTMLLMTANHRLKYAAEILRERLAPHGIAVFDSVSDRRAVDAFRATERALLIGSERYGEGVDLPGRQLSCVIIEKINEAMTRGPLPDARKSRTRFGLYEYDFPLRMMWLKQRVGRLIRSADDRGAVVVFDPRFHGWSAPSRNHVISALAPIPVRSGTRDEIFMQIEGMKL